MAFCAPAFTLERDFDPPTEFPMVQLEHNYEEVSKEKWEVPTVLDGSSIEATSLVISE
jgi:hypothetical protein